MALETYVQIHQRFDRIIAEVKKVASEVIDFIIKGFELEKLTAEEQVKLLYNALQKNKQDIDDFKTIEYYCFADQEQLIFKIYSYRIFCNDRNEEQAIRDGFLLSEKNRRIKLLYLKAKKQIPAFTIGHFLTNKYNVVFYELDEQPHGTSDKDYQDICCWQISNRKACVQLEFSKLKENFIDAFKDRKASEIQLQAEINQLEKIYNNLIEWTSDHLLVEVFKLKGLTGMHKPADKDVFHDLFYKAIKGDKLKRMLSPQFFDTTNDQIKKSIISSPPIFVSSIMMYLRWLSDVFSGKEEMTDYSEFSLDELFHISFNEGLALGRIDIDIFNNKYQRKLMSNEQYYSEIIQEYCKQREIFDKLVYPDYFTFLEKKSKLKNCFINDCLNCINIEIPIVELKRTIVLNEMVVLLEDKLRIVKGNLNAPFAFRPYNTMQLAEIFCHLAPDSEQIKQLLKILNKSTARMHNNRIPLYFISEGLNRAYTSLFKKAVIKYKHAVEMMDPDKRRCFIAEQIRDIKYMGRLNEIESSEINPYLKHLKHIDKDELESINNLQPYKEAEEKKPTSNKEAKEKKVVEKKDLDDDKPTSFGYHPGPFELEPIMEALKIKINIFKGENAIKEFMIAFTCKDLSQIHTIFRLGCQTNQLKFVMEELEEYSTNFNPASIEKSGLFISKKGKPITANCITSSNTDTLRSKRAIKNIFLNKH